MDRVWEDGVRRSGKGRARKAGKRERRRGEQRREEPGPDAPEEIYRDAEELAEAKLAFWRDAAWYGLWTGLALAFLFPIGVIMLLFGAPKRVRRFARLYLEPQARAHLLEAELRRQAEREALAAGPRPEPAPSPGAGRAGYDRAALEELERVERSVSRELRAQGRLALAELRMADVVESALASLQARAAEQGVALERRLDADTSLRGDAEKLGQALRAVVSQALEALRASPGASPRIEVELGENLAGSAVWVRVRDSGPAAGRRVPAGAERMVAAHGGRIELGPDPAGGTEVLVTLPRQLAG